MNQHDQHNPGLPEELCGLEASLDALGKHERDAAPDDLGRRIADEGAETIASPSRGHLRLTGTDAEPAQAPAWRQHWRMAASIALLIVAVVAAISQNQRQTTTGPIATNNPDTGANVIDDDWIEFEMQYLADTALDDDDFESLASELDDLELSFSAGWTLDENLNLNEGESI